jgi:hypothetical protein
MTFNESEKNDNISGYSDDDNNHDNDSPEMVPFQANLNMLNTHNFSFDSLANLGKNDNYHSNMSFYPRKQSLTNPFDKHDKF